MKLPLGRGTRRGALLVVILGLVLPQLAVAPADAYTTNPNTWNMAGRPIGGSAGDGDPDPAYQWCQGIAYGKVDGDKVLFTARHCADNTNVVNPITGAVVDKDDNLVGYWVPATEISSDFDFGYLILASGVWPSNPHQVYCGDNSGTPCWRSNTSGKPSSDLACDNVDSTAWGAGGSADNFYASFQTQWTSVWDNRVGNMEGYWTYHTSYCRLETDLASHCDTCYIDSGTPSHLYSYGGAPGFFAHLKEQLTCGVHLGFPPCTSSYGTNIILKPLYNPMFALDAYWESHGSNLGAHFCTSSSCPAI